MGDAARRLSDLETPCLTVDLRRVKLNCERMRNRASQLGLQLRPHMKTCKTIEGGRLLTGGTCRRIVVSTVAEAEYFADGGFDDIAYGHLVTEDKIPRLRALAQRLEELHLFIDCSAHVHLLEAQPVSDDKKWSVFVKVNTGYNRAGVQWHDAALPELVRRVTQSPHLTFKGVYIHEGMCYDKQGHEVSTTADATIHRLIQVVELLSSEGISCDTVSVGSTPSCSLPGKLMGKVTEIHPGNYVFYDVQQVQIGSCARSDIAVRVATRVMAHYPDRNELIVDCGFTALSHDGKGQMHNGTWCEVEKHPNIQFARISQEYGVLTSHDGSPLQYDRLPIGHMLFLLPYHACATAAMHPTYYVHEEDDVIEIWHPNRGW